MAETKSLDTIQVLRGVAALMVVVHHACIAVILKGSRPVFPSQLHFFADCGAAGVDIFFVISGFIMVYVSRDSFGRPGAAARFWLRRLIRIAPLYWIYTTLMLALVLSRFGMEHPVFSLPYTIKSYLFIPAFDPATHRSLPQPLLSPGWTLFYEMFFYLIFGLWILLGRLKTLVPFILLCFSGSLITSRLLGMETALGVFLAQPIMFEFLYGVIVGSAFIKGWHPERRMALCCVWLSAGVLVLTIFVRPSIEWRALIWGLPSAVLVYGAAGLSVGQGRIATAFVRLGDSSYSLYIQHALVILAIGGLLKRKIFLHHLPPHLLIVLIVATCVGLAWCGYVLLERPMNQWLAERLRLRRKTIAPGLAVSEISPADTGPVT